LLGNLSLNDSSQCGRHSFSNLGAEESWRSDIFWETSCPSNTAAHVSTDELGRKVMILLAAIRLFHG
jgi:hypothetical protein